MKIKDNFKSRDLAGGEGDVFQLRSLITAYYPWLNTLRLLTGGVVKKTFALQSEDLNSSLIKDFKNGVYVFPP